MAIIKLTPVCPCWEPKFSNSFISIPQDILLPTFSVSVKNIYVHIINTLRKKYCGALAVFWGDWCLGRSRVVITDT